MRFKHSTLSIMTLWNITLHFSIDVSDSRGSSTQQVEDSFKLTHSVSSLPVSLSVLDRALKNSDEVHVQSGGVVP
ncbi:hypothetical protein EIP91_002842 [Steccherinum ochraceum]|uniref:Uncharacterized protein n=1 Tax=Steccherinum ochraceum TaxID=92696 RepID=A0A4R0RBA3_9APHY|nr:hypothetical protein EIP91_002842 [Steccherinum ochraceum]